MSNGIGIAVISYHSAHDLSRFLESLKESVPIVPVSLVVSLVDVYPEEEAAAVDDVRHTIFDMDPNVFVTINVHRGNIGYAKACNAAAVVWADQDWVRTYAFFNADTELRPGVLEECDLTLWSEDSYGVLGPRQIDRQGLITHAGIVGPPPRHRAFKVSGTAKEYVDLLDDCWSVMGSAYFTKAPLWWELTECPLYQSIAPDVDGAFLPTKHFYEDEFYSRHAVAHGRKVVYDGRVTMIHQQGGSTPSHTWAMQKMQESRVLYEAACVAHGISSK